MKLYNLTNEEKLDQFQIGIYHLGLQLRYFIDSPQVNLLDFYIINETKSNQSKFAIKCINSAKMIEQTSTSIEYSFLDDENKFFVLFITENDILIEARVLRKSNLEI